MREAGEKSDKAWNDKTNEHAYLNAIIKQAEKDNQFAIDFLKNNKFTTKDVRKIQKHDKNNVWMNRNKKST